MKKLKHPSTNPTPCALLNRRKFIGTISSATAAIGAAGTGMPSLLADDTSRPAVIVSSRRSTCVFR